MNSKTFFHIKYKYYTFAEMGKARKLLYPVSLLYGGIMRLRNNFYDRKIFESHSFEIPVICVGNLSMGGTGKSPMVEYLIALLKDEVKVATLSRGYKRTTSGFFLLNGNESAAETGDEPLQFKTKFPDVTVAVDEKRSRGIETLLRLNKPPDVILLDDAFQHRKVSAELNILLTPYHNLYSDDLVLPAGNLREPVSGADRARVIVVTKCPQRLSGEEKSDIRNKLRIKHGQQLYFSKVVYGEQAVSRDVSVDLENFRNGEFCLVTGIANPAPLVKHLKNLELNFEHLRFPDHHNFISAELNRINEHQLVLTTEKDFMRLKGEIAEDKLFYLPIKTAFLDDGIKFDRFVKSYAIKK